MTLGSSLSRSCYLSF